MKVVILTVLCVSVVGVWAQTESPVYHSPMTLVANLAGSRVFAIDETASQVSELDTSTQKVLRTIALPGRPTGAALNRSASRIYVTSDTPANSIFVVDLNTGKTESTMGVGHGPMSPVLSGDESLLYVCNRFDNNVSVIDLRENREVKQIPVIREPVTAALSPNGKLLVVGNQKPDGSAKSQDFASSVSLIDAAANSVSATIRLPEGGGAIRGVAISPDSRYAYVSHLLGRPHVPATQLEQGWLNANAFSVIDLEHQGRLNTMVLDQMSRGAGNPWGIAVAPDGNQLYVVLAGVHQLAIVNLPPLLEKLRALKEHPVESGYHVRDRPDTDLTFLDSYMRRIPLKGRGPRPIVIQGGRAYLGMYFSGTIESVDLGNPKAESTLVSLGSQPAETDVRRGERLFHDASVSFQGWQSCSTCHTDGRSDGFNWDLTNDGVGTTKNTKSLLFTWATPPVTWTGVFPSIVECVPHELKTILFASPPKEDAAAMIAFLKSLQPVPNPYLEKGKLSAAAQRGQLAFTKGGCNECHKGEYLTAMQNRNVGTNVLGDRTNAFDIPTLREVWRTAPYLHDGRAASIKDIFDNFNPQKRHGKAANLSPQELDDLVQYVLTL